MARPTSSSHSRKFNLFLNTSFLFLLSFYLTTQIPQSLHQSSVPTRPIRNISQLLHDSEDSCTGLQTYEDNESKCMFLRTATQCKPEGYIDYLQLFYCTCGHNTGLGFTILVLWLILLFYLLANTTAFYFCSSLESLSRILKLSPTIAGVTLLSLGNGAPDVFSSIVSFMGAGAGEVGLNSVLGGAFFVSSVVTGIISISVSRRRMSIDKSSFVRDVCFLLLTLCYLSLVLVVGRINIWGAMGFFSLYFIYVFVVSGTHFCRKKEGEVDIFAADPLLPIDSGYFCSESAEFRVPLLGNIDKELAKEALENEDQTVKKSWFSFHPSVSYKWGRFLYLLELPVYLPRRLTIPDVCEERWSKPFAVASATLAPLLLAVIWNSQEGNMSLNRVVMIYIFGGLTGIILGAIAFFTTEKSNPPKKFLFPWLAGGFVMSVIWTYIIAQELVSLLVSLGNILGISPSILGLTVLAWGNSLGDLIANVAMALNEGSDGAQTAISGCYGGPMFNTLVGLGLSLVISTWQVHPSSYVIPKDSSLFQTLGFLVGGLLWALVILPRKEMRLDRVLGFGLLSIYLCFLSLNLAQTLGLLQLHGFHG